MNFVSSNPHRVNELSEAVFGTLLLECFVECDRIKCSCSKSHDRDWMWNLGFLIEHNKLHLVMKDIENKLQSPLPNVRSILFLGLRNEYAHQLEHVQMLIPFPLNVPKLFDNLTSLSINIRYIRLRRDLPVIPTRCLRILEVFQIEAVIPWHLFETTNGALSFDSLQDLRGRVFERLTIMDDPTNFERINEHAFETAPFVDVYSVDMVERLYQLPSSVEVATLGLLDYPLPGLIAWHGLANLLGQLPLLHTLVVDCFSMIRNDAKVTKFPDQKITFDEIGEVLDPSSQLPVSESLERLDLFVRGTFDLVGFCELVVCLPRVTKVRVNHHMIPHIMSMLHQVFKVSRNIAFEPLS
ncbi:hypothetical protein DL89DRAFT_291487 [Linderina pennispora]|uniref:Uncharacterized protein n=1 Tax=Linderina pennispora TaxID=61395 RepID=A0A1Y1WFM1_9FUNG|nr:uncharacterized protein DL89DRAFT_291487 [Linderina pennispora]ORX72287.1 hypothetical protein DL89DRAFT_291487 [Linderina pennispora]